MPPKYKFTREEIVQAGLNAVRSGGIDALTARAVGAALGASPKVIFGMFQNMEALRAAVLGAAHKCYLEFLTREIESGRYPPYKASGMGYIFFAQEEPALFRLLFMRDRTGEQIADKIEGIEDILAILRETLGFSYQEAQNFHLQMWLYVHGIATMSATGYLNLPQDRIERLLTQIYEGLRLYFQYQKGEYQEGDADSWRPSRHVI